MHLGESQKKDRKSYFVGVPAPAAAGLMLMPLGFEFILERFSISFAISLYPLCVILWVFIISMLMISSIPTFSFRNVRFNVATNRALLVLLSVCLGVAIFMKETWIFLFSVGCLYLLSIPFSFFASQKDIKEI
jgi:CDP-diacylglycerol--serine O-phosphatidyltransferase